MKDKELFDMLYEEYTKDCHDKIMATKNVFDDEQKKEYAAWHKERLLKLCKIFKEKGK